VKLSDDGKKVLDEIDYDTRSGDVAFIDKGVWHQANPISKGTRWALVIFYKVER
jgi:quercetin dioxygenase-like cupin family protein